MASELRFDGRVAVITGAGAGLGRSHALLLASRGAAVVVNDLGGSRHGEGKSSRAADAVVEEIKAAGGKAVANTDSVEDGARIVQTALDAFGRIDILINNAGILRDTSFAKMTPEDWDLIYRVHVLGAMRTTHAAWAHMRDAGYGRILFTTSAAGLYGNFGQANYSTAKMGLVGLARTLAAEGEKKNVLVNAIAPVAGSRLTETILPPEIVDALKPEYVSALAAWLCHDTCTDTGGVFEVGGGFYGKLRWERTEGKMFAAGRPITPESVSASWDQIVDFGKTTHPTTAMESIQPVLNNLGKKSKGGNELIDVDAALGYELDSLTSSYDERDLALYALGVGAGANPTDERELHLVYERNSDGFWPLPTYGVIPAINAILKLALEGKSAPGLNYGLDRILHGEQTTEVTRPLPPQAKLRHKARISEIFDKGKNAVVVTHVDSFDAETGELLIKNDISMIVRGAGGWGGDRGPTGEQNSPPDRKPDAVVEEKTSAAQALLYRLSGDWNPLHVDPGFATAFGFERPILHGLCTYGYVGRHVVNALLDGDPRRFKSIKVRFADSVFPGETLITEMWKQPDGRVLVRARVKERDKVVISQAAVELYDRIPEPKATAAIGPAPATTSAAPTAATAAVAAVAAAPGTIDVFAALKAHVAANGELAASIKTSFGFRFKSPGSEWTIDLKSTPATVVPGLHGKPDVTLELEDSDFLTLVGGKADAQQLYMSGKLKVTGNVMASNKLKPLLKIDKALVDKAFHERTGGVASGAPSAPAPAPAGAGRVGCAAAAFAALDALMKKNPALAQEVRADVRFQLKDPDAAWTCRFKGTARFVPGADGDVDATLTLRDEDLERLCRGTVGARELFQHGALRVDGDVAVAHRLTFLAKLL